MNKKCYQIRNENELNLIKEHLHKPIAVLSGAFPLRLETR